MVIGEMVAELLLGPSVIGAILQRVQGLLFPSNGLTLLQGCSEAGLVLFLFVVGLRFEAHELGAVKRSAVSISAANMPRPSCPALPWRSHFTAAFPCPAYRKRHLFCSWASR